MRFYGIAALLAALLLYLGNPAGLFRPGRGAPAGGEGRDPRDGPQPQANPEHPTGTAPSAAQSEPQGGTGAAAPPSGARNLDRALGRCDRLDDALRGDRLGEVARILEDAAPPPDELRVRWTALRAKAEAALACGDRLRALVRDGRVLEARQLANRLRDPALPARAAASLDTAAQHLGWPPLSRPWRVATAVPLPASEPLPKLRKVRFVRDGTVGEGALWQHAVAGVTLRTVVAGGYTYPVVPCTDVEPVAPTPAEALQHGIAVAAAGDGFGALLWSCYLDEHGRRGDAERLRELLR